MKHYLKGRTLYHGEIIEPKTPIAEFSDKLSMSAIKGMVAAMNYGNRMLYVYDQMGRDTDILNVVDMLESMEAIHSEWKTERYNAIRDSK